MYPYYHGYIEAKEGTRLVQEIAQAINGEYSAIACYEKLIKMASTDEEKKRIREIRQDEVRHFHLFSDIYTKLTNRKPVPRITEECPREYKAGLIAAFYDEQETVDFYLDIADRARDPFIKEAFRRGAADEQNHAVYFLNYIVKHNAYHSCDQDIKKQQMG